MLVLTTSLVLISTILLHCESAFVDNLPKCKINDGECERDLVQTLMQDISKTGIPELDIPPVDPMVLKNVSMSVLNFIDLNMLEVNVKGIKDCKVEKFVTDIEDEHAFIEISCDSVNLKGHYKAFASNSLIKTLLGGETIHGDGNVKLKIEKMNIRFDFFFYVQQRDNDIYLKCKRDKLTYKYDIGNMFFYIDDLFLGSQDASTLVTTLLNENWRMVMSAFGKPFMDKAMEYPYKFIHSFFLKVPAKYFISGDLSEYARP